MGERRLTFTNLDKIVFLIVLLTAIAVSFLFVFFNFGKEAEAVEIFVDGKEYGTYLLTEIHNRKIVDIKTEFGENKVEITPTGARIIYASCKDKIDVQAGEISKVGQSIHCLPNRVSVRITGKEREFVDRVTY